MPRFTRVAAALLVLCLTGSASAQQARATGTVKDTDGRPIKGATVRAVNPEASPPEIASTTDDRGRWAMIGLRSGPWTLIAEAPGFSPVQATAQMRISAAPPLNFTLARDPGPIPGALDRAVMQQVASANALRDKGDYAQAVSAYQVIRDQNPKLTSMNLVIAGVYRRQAAAETDLAARRTLLERAIETYGQLLDDESVGARAKAEIASTRTEVEALPR
jgi:hypothetical protein